MAISLNSLNSTVSSYGTRITNLEKKIGAGGGIIASSLGASGYVKFANGLIINWGSISLSNDTTRYATFPLAFTTTNYRVVAQKTSAEHTNNTPMKINAREKTRFGMYAYQVWACDWIAIGYLISNRAKNWLFNKISSIKGLI